MYINLKSIRKNKNISVIKLRKILGLTTNAAYYKKENGTVKFTLEEAKKISDYIGMSIEDIFFTNNVPNKN